MMTRRGLMAGALGSGLVLGGCGRDGRRPGLQLYTLRDAMQASVEATLERVAGIGYREVEFAGYFGRSPAQIRQTLAANGLSAPSAHVEAELARSEPQAAIDAVLEAGHAQAVIAWIPEHLRQTADDWRGWAETLNDFGALCRTAGLGLAYHNHDFEFHRTEDVVPFDLIWAQTDPALVSFELDLYWVRHAGRDAAALLAHGPARFTLCHAKDRAADGSMTDIGTGEIDFARFLNLPEARHIAHVYAEHDNAADPWAFAETAYPALAAALG